MGRFLNHSQENFYMTMDIESMLCELCNSQCEYRIINSTQGWHCKNCGWSVVTTYIPEIDRDEEHYSVLLDKNIHFSTEVVKTISKIKNINYLEGLEWLKTSDSILCKGKARYVLEIINMLEENGLSYSITPKYKYFKRHNND